MTVEYRAVREDELEECLNLWCTVWKGPDNPAYFRRYFYGDVEWLPYYTQVAVVDGKLVSAVQICKRTVACGEFRLTMGGIANVATLPEYRGQGHNAECMRRAIAVMEADAMDFSLLFTGINDYYANFGYATVSRPGLNVVLKPDIASRSTGLQVRAATAEDLPAVRALYDSYNRERPIAVQRYEAYWREWIRIKPDKIPDTLLVAVDASGSMQGYIRTGTFNSAIPYSADEVEARVIEFGVASELTSEQESEVTIALLDAVAAKLPAAERRVLRLSVALEPYLLEALKPMAQDQEVSVTRSGMARLLHRDNLFKSLTLAWNERWREAGRPQGEIVFQTPYGATKLDAFGPFLRVMPVEEGKEGIGQEIFFGLLVGSLRPDEATPYTELHPLLQALFPRRAFVYWPADGF